MLENPTSLSPFDPPHTRVQRLQLHLPYSCSPCTAGATQTLCIVSVVGFTHISCSMAPAGSCLHRETSPSSARWRQVSGAQSILCSQQGWHRDQAAGRWQESSLHVQARRRSQEQPLSIPEERTVGNLTLRSQWFSKDAGQDCTAPRAAPKCPAPAYCSWPQPGPPAPRGSRSCHPQEQHPAPHSPCPSWGPGPAPAALPQNSKRDPGIPQPRALAVPQGARPRFPPAQGRLRPLTAPCSPPHPPTEAQPSPAPPLPTLTGAAPGAEAEPGEDGDDWTGSKAAAAGGEERGRGLTRSPPRLSARSGRVREGSRLLSPQGRRWRYLAPPCASAPGRCITEEERRGQGSDAAAGGPGARRRCRGGRAQTRATRPSLSAAQPCAAGPAAATTTVGDRKWRIKSALAAGTSSRESSGRGRGSAGAGPLPGARGHGQDGGGGSAAAAGSARPPPPAAQGPPPLRARRHPGSGREGGGRGRGVRPYGRGGAGALRDARPALPGCRCPAGDGAGRAEPGAGRGAGAGWARLPAGRGGGPVRRRL